MSTPNPPAFIDKFPEDDEARVSNEPWERELQRLLICDGQPQGTDESLIERLVDSRQERQSTELEKYLSEDVQPLPGDEALVARLVDKCLEEKESAQGAALRLSTPRRRSFLWLAAALPLIGAVSWAAVEGGFWGAERNAPALVSNAASKNPNSKAPAEQIAPSIEVGSEESLPKDSTASRKDTSETNAEPVQPKETRSSSERQAAVVPTAPSVADNPMALFKELKQARRGGKMNTFFSLGRRLQTEFPGSGEAQVSRILLGRALLESGSAAAALKQFDAYGARGGTMLEEALVGQARASAQLGLSSKELKAWKNLLQRFPNSVHSAHAERRIIDLQAK